MAKKHTDSFLVAMPLMSLVNRMRAYPIASPKNEFPDGTGGVVFKMAEDISAMSWGEVISVHMSIYDATQTLIEIESESSNPVQLMDVGKNKKNVERIKAWLLGQNVAV